jgi:hypothetical protein
MPRVLRAVGLVASWVVAALVLTFVMINIHEIGHTAAARLAGDPHASYSLYRRYPDGQFDCIGCNAYNPRLLSFWGKWWVVVAGVQATQMVALLSLFGLRSARRSPVVWFWRLWIAILVGGDALWQTVQAVLAPVATQTGLTNVDFADALYLLRVHEGYSVVVLKVLLVLLTGLYVLGMAWLVIRLPRKRPTS